MLEILYDTATNEVRGWNGDDDAQGNFAPTPDQAVVIWDTPIPDFESDVYFIDLAGQVIIGNPDYIKPIPRDSLAEIDDLRARIEHLEQG